MSATTKTEVLEKRRRYSTAALFASKAPVAEAPIALRRATWIALPAATLDRVAKRVVGIADGAAWIWNLAGDRFHGAVHRVDIFHVNTADRSKN